MIGCNEKHKKLVNSNTNITIRILKINTPNVPSNTKCCLNILHWNFHRTRTKTEGNKWKKKKNTPCSDDQSNNQHGNISIIQKNL